MTRKLPKLRLKKQVIVAIPVLLVLIVFTIGMIINRTHVYSSSVEMKEEYAKLELTDTIELSDLEFIKNVSNNIENQKRDNTIVYYASKFKLDVDKTLEIAHKYTDNYTNERFTKLNIIGPESVVKDQGKFDSFEAGAVYFVRDLYRSPSSYGTSEGAIVTSKEVTVANNREGYTVYLDNGLTFTQFLGIIADLYGIDKSTALAIVYEESGYTGSGLFRNSNNIGGLRGAHGWNKYPTLEAGTICYILTLRSLANRSHVDFKSNDAIPKLSGIYVYGNPSKVADSWVAKVTKFRNGINQKDLFTIK